MKKAVKKVAVQSHLGKERILPPVIIEAKIIRPIGLSDVMEAKVIRPIGITDLGKIIHPIGITTEL